MRAPLSSPSDSSGLDRAMPDEADKQVLDRVKLARENGAPELYANGLGVALGSSDILLVLERNKIPVGVVNLSFTSAKSLAVALGSVIAELEERADREILTNQDITDLFSVGEDSNDGDVLATH